MKTFSIKTLGCKLNQYESALIAQQFLQAGWNMVGFGQKSDIVLINTCTVTDRSDKKCRNYIRQGAKSSAAGKVYVSGCLIDRAGSEIASMIEVKKVFANKNKDDLVFEILSDFNETAPAELNNKYLITPQNRCRAFLKIQDGCDGKCAYCIIPSVRGVPSSKNFNEILENVKILEQNNVYEIVMTGITIGKYDHEGRDLADLVMAMLDVSKTMRFRITSIEPVHISGKIISLFSHERICSHVHLPLQSGSDKVLKEMNRPYTVADYLAMCTELRKICPNIAIGTDVIVGFPGESEEDFKQTMNTLKAADIAYIHQFTFSPRSGTAAAGRNDFCKDSVVTERSEILREFSDKQRLNYQKKFIDKKLTGILEKDSSGWWATTGNYIRVKLTIDESFKPVQGSFSEILITGINKFPQGKICRQRVVESS